MMKFTKYLLLVLSISLSLAGCDNNDTIDKVDSLKLYDEVTRLKTEFNEQNGHKFELPDNVKSCVNQIVKESNVYDYMSSKDALSYTKKSQYAKDSEDTINEINKLLEKFKDIGFINAIKKSGKIPGLMFDIDNTIQLSSFEDDYFSKGKIVTPAIVDFIKKQCFKDGIACYFITARYCNNKAATATAEWLKSNLDLTSNQLEKFVFFSGSIDNSLCASKPNQKVAYKDSFRQALSEQKNVYWLMSVGDQMTDWYGSHSGLKVRFPNQMFHSEIVPNNYNKENDCDVRTVIEPTQQCYNQLKEGILEHSTINYCKEFNKNKYFAGRSSTP
ncbi:HAD family acid phosphatase [Allofrancisella frigidaquae]|uniref:Acid phosphatase n=1 Tax=Allofrancisella frigidaquae TaxID=1085644 RepID=A0A6M3HUP5_9GAMM|nr:HAD family acid phosphatase [Allofrancisella frigidaquae]QIV94934.1 hypothetical protein E3E15_06050 [Allofrancisella frigidaquae]